MPTFNGSVFNFIADLTFWVCVGPRSGGVIPRRAITVTLTLKERTTSRGRKSILGRKSIGRSQGDIGFDDVWIQMGSDKRNKRIIILWKTIQNGVNVFICGVKRTHGRKRVNYLLHIKKISTDGPVSFRLTKLLSGFLDLRTSMKRKISLEFAPNLTGRVKSYHYGENGGGHGIQKPWDNELILPEMVEIDADVSEESRRVTKSMVHLSIPALGARRPTITAPSEHTRASKRVISAAHLRERGL